jgi:hypothetical protein
MVKIEEALQRADHGIGLARQVLAADPGQADAKRLLSQLNRTKSTLGRWQKDLREQERSALASAHRETPNVPTPAPPANVPPIKVPEPGPVVRPPEPEPAPERPQGLDAGAVRDVFTRFKAAVVSRDPSAIRSVFPKYPSTDALSKLREFRYDFEVLSVDPGRKVALVRQTTRQRHPPDYWDPASTVTLRYVLDQRDDGAWFIVSGSLVP